MECGGHAAALTAAAWPPHSIAAIVSAMRLLLAIAIASILFAALFALAIHFTVPRDFAAAFAAPVFAVVG